MFIRIRMTAENWGIVQGHLPPAVTRGGEGHDSAFRGIRAIHTPTGTASTTVAHTAPSTTKGTVRGTSIMWGDSLAC